MSSVIFWLPCSESASLPFPQKIISSQLQREDCIVDQNAGEFGSYIEEFLFTDKRAGLSLYSCINWAEGFLKSEGLGKKGSMRAAELVARNNALKTLLTVNLHADSTFQKYFSRQAQVRLKIQNVLIKNARMEELPADPEQPDAARVIVHIPFYGISGLTSFLIDDQELYLVPPTEKSQTLPAESSSASAEYSGIIIDVRHISPIQPALLPKILSEDGEILYEASQVDKNILQGQGMIEYVSETEKRTTWRTGHNPLIIKPVLLASADKTASQYWWRLAQERTRKRRRRGNNLVVDASSGEGQIPVNVVVSVEDAKKIKQLNEEQQLDQQGKYTILIGGEIGGVKGQYLEGLYAMQAD